MRNLIRKVSVLLLTVAMCMGMCADVVVYAQETDFGVMTEQAETVTGQKGENIKLSASELHAPRIEADSSMTVGQKVTWDCVWFGNYPQAEVIPSSEEYSALDKNVLRRGDTIVDTELYNILQNAEGWNDNNDIILENGDKYRRIKLEDATNASSYPYLMGYTWLDTDTYHFFKYEPIKWRILNVYGKQAFLLSDIVLDTQRYNVKYEDIKWEDSTIRSWLNGYDTTFNHQKMDYSDKNFIGCAFDLEEQPLISESFILNEDNAEYGTVGGDCTTDKVFLLSISEVSNISYGFSSWIGTTDEARMCKSSTYAKAMGLSYSDDKYFGDFWYLRSPGMFPTSVAYVSGYGDTGGTYGCCDVDDKDNGVRPALNLNLSSNQWSYAGTVCSDGTVAEKGGVDSPGEDTNATFKLGRDNNSFLHWSPRYSQSGFYNVSNYKTSKAFKDKLFANATSKEKDALKESFEREWEGSCYGIAALMSLIYNGD